MRMRLDCAGVSDVGRSRAVNQDQFLIADLKKSMLIDSTTLPLAHQSRLYGGSMGRLLMVADGMGGHAAGERASTLAVDDLIVRLLNSVHWFFHLDRDPEDDFVEDLKRLLRNAHRRIVREGMAHSDRRGMGTTLTLAYIIGPRLYVVHAGDTRCYLFRDGEVERLTVDHTLAHRLVETGGIRAEEESTSRWSNVLWNVLGGGEGEPTAEVRRVDLVPGDALLLCSDGLYRYCHDDELMRVVTSGRPAEAVCRELVNTANERGGQDNITAVVALFSEENGREVRATVQREVPLEDVIGTRDEPVQETVRDTADTLPG